MKRGLPIIVALALVGSVSPAGAGGWYGGHHHHGHHHDGHDVGLAVGFGLLGIAIGTGVALGAHREPVWTAPSHVVEAPPQPVEVEEAYRAGYYDGAADTHARGPQYAPLDYGIGTIPSR